MKLSEVVLSHGDNNEATAIPYWAIVEKAGLGRLGIVAGIWFNRDDAESYLKAKHYRMPKKAFVYCFSGNESWQMRELYTIARAEVAS